MKLLKGVTVSVLLFLLCFVAPFNIYADTAVVMGTDVSLIDSSLLRTEQYTSSSGTVTANNVLYTYNVTVQLDNNYVGYLLLKLDYSYYNNPQSGFRVDSSSATRRVFINGDKAEFNFTIDTWYSSDPLLRNTTNGTPNVVIQDQGVTLLSELDSIQQIIDILNDLYNSTDQIEGLLNDQLTQLQLVVSNTSLANQYLDTLSKLRNWNIYFESYPLNMYLFNQRYSVFNSYSYNYLNYPIFTIPSGSRIYSSYFRQRSTEYLMIFISDNNISSITKLKNTLSISNSNFDFYDFEILNTFVGFGTSYNQIIKVKFKSDINAGESSVNFSNSLGSDLHFLGIYIGKLDNYYNTDFALLFGLSNKLLDDLDIIANGTSQSNQQASDLSSGTDSMQQQMNDFTSQEDSYNQQMNNSINAIDFSSPVSQNAGILPAANFVISIFNGLIQNNAFSVLILIVCVLIIGKKVIGK